MPSLSETQAGFRQALGGAAPQALLASLRCPADPDARLDIYRRHFRESFRRHLRGRYPTLEWLLGTDVFIALADDTLRRAPPQAPSMAEYGGELADLLRRDGAGLPPYLADVALVDWTLGRLSVAADAPAIGIASLSAVAPDDVERVVLNLQAGLAHIASEWPVDELIHLRHAGDAPGQLAFRPEPALLELRGSRGRFSLRRTDPGAFAFRRRIAAGESLGRAAEHALAAEPAFDLAAALAALFAEGLVISHTGHDDHA